MNFQEAIKEILEFNYVAREGWNEWGDKMQGSVVYICRSDLRLKLSNSEYINHDINYSQNSLSKLTTLGCKTPIIKIWRIKQKDTGSYGSVVCYRTDRHIESVNLSVEDIIAEDWELITLPKN